MDGQASKNAEETPQTESVEKKKTPIKDSFQVGWGERAISSAVLILIPLTGASGPFREIIEKATPFIAGLCVILASIGIVYCKDCINEKRNRTQKTRSREAFVEATQSLELMLSSDHIDEKTKNEVLEKINGLYSRRALKLEQESINTEDPEIYSTLANTLSDLENNIIKK